MKPRKTAAKKRERKAREFVLTLHSRNGLHTLEYLEEVVDGIRYMVRLGCFDATPRNYYQIKVREVKAKKGKVK